MSDFDDVLERLVSDPTFKAALATNPDAALAGYRLEASERELLGVQVVSGDGADRTVEVRTNKSGVVGMLGPVAAALGVASGTLGSGQLTHGSGTLGSAPVPEGNESFGTATGDGVQTLGSAGPTEGIGTAAAPDHLGAAPTEATGYHTRVDVDGDGRWDAHKAYERADGGVDITADSNHDGKVDFVGHDYNRDGLVDVAEFDNDGDGVLDTRMYDDNGDGWMDRSEAIPPAEGQAQSFGTAPGPAN